MRAPGLPSQAGTVDEVEWVSYLEAARRAGRSVAWVRNHVNRGRIRRRIADDGTRRRYVVAADVQCLADQLDTAKAREHDRPVPSAPPGMLSIVNAAVVLGCTRSHVFALGRTGRLTIRSGRPASYVDADQVHALFRSMLGGYDPDEVMTYTEAADHLRFSVEQIRRRIRWGQLRRIGTARHLRVLRTDVLRLATELTVQACSRP